MTFFSSVSRFLLGNDTSCISCNQSFRQASTISQELCWRCDQQIPWISNISCYDCGRQTNCIDCIRRRADEADWLDYHRAAVQYSQQMKHWLYHYKYRGDQRWQYVMTQMLQIIWQTEYAKQIDFITFVPVSIERLHERTFNQAEQLAKQLSIINNVPVLPLLHRRKDTGKQSSKSRIERTEMMDSVFESIEQPDEQRAKMRKSKIVIIDDIYTTGNTMHACARAIREKYDVNIYGLSWARS